MGTLCLCHCFHVRDPEEDVSTCQNCFCPSCIIHTLLAKFTAIFRKEQSDAPASTAQMAASLSSDTAARISHFDSSNATRSSQQEHDGRITEQENEQVDMEHDSEENKSEDEDVCPTCLEEYIPENPKIVLQCSHCYHLSCIFEWMGRSENCPICDKETQKPEMNR